MKEPYTNIYSMQEKGIEFNPADGFSATIELLIQDDNFVKALYNRKIKNIKLLYEEVPNWQEKEHKKRIKEINGIIKELQQELVDLQKGE